MKTPRRITPRLLRRLAPLACAALVLTVACSAPAAEPAPPNIVFILADDLGYSDLACYGNPYHRTPHLDRLAAQGVRFTGAYAPAPICSASRAAILTGRTPARLHFEFVTKDKPGSQTPAGPLITPPYPTDLPLEEVTIAEALKPAGYITGFFGKWHVNQHYGGYLGWSPTHGPLRQGFDEGDPDFGSHPYGYARKQDRAFGEFADGQYPDDTLTDKAIAFLRAHQKQRFFLYLSEYYVHDPVHTRCKWLFDEVRRRLPAEAPDVRAAYGAMVQTLDHLVGRVLTALDEFGLADNTLVVFTSDNGGHPLYSANAPLRGSKWNLYEGGIRVPTIVRWPGRVAAASVSDQPIIGIDWLPTFCAAAGAPLPAGVELDGRDITGVLTGRDGVPGGRSLVWHFPYYHPEAKFAAALPRIGISDFAVSQTRPHSSIDRDGYTLLHFYEDGRDELYRLADDLGQQHDLSAAEPAKTDELRGALQTYLRHVDARLPQPRSPDRKEN